MRSEKLTRAWFAVTAVVAGAGLVTQVVATASADGRVANLLCFFTIDSNLLVLLTSALVALGRARGRLFTVLWLDALAGIIVTGIVYQVALAGLYDLHGLSLVSDTMLHKVTPLLFVLGWLLVGPRGAVTWRTVWWSLLYPLAWLAFTLPRGAIDGFYPYPFVDAATLGYGQVALNCVFIGLFFTALAAGAFVYDRRLTPA
ncbi:MULTISPECIES: Pr6Pr family membrane protein [unclassified Amycolatopsis]|uniref:Pr6Pr family membrane protein n=1 Tax=unclassified Amycolatopsis TaxID=2618356 RepID=UPI002876BBE1|nr:MULTISPECIES: Pr6Pr family membrane protein [unclassified Amycolatopsis]MDS0137440.1 Pr6Pr family membrane protein [Amycolatopsis sp. 505]MDS0141635.1 Pr6Pr family membrane protein [Amycolatopsis sp. CM201R]